MADPTTPSKGAKLFAAFDTIVGVSSLVIDIIGIAGPDPLESKLDAISSELAEINSKLDDLRDAIDGLGQDILAEFDKLTKRDLATARAKIETAWDELNDFERKENPTAADMEKLSDLADAALNEMMAQFVELDPAIPYDMAAVMVDAINYAIAMRLKVAMVAEDGAIGKDSIKDGLLDAAAALKKIETGFFATLGDYVSTTVTTSYTNPFNQEREESWSGTDQSGIRFHFQFKDSTPFERWSDDYRIVGVSDLTGATQSVTVHISANGLAGFDALNFALGTMNRFIVNQDKAALTELSDTIILYEELADGSDIVGTSGKDTRTGTAGNDLITGLGGNDMLSGGDDADVIRGGSGQDRLNGDNGRDLLDGGAGRDRMSGGAGADTLIGGGAGDVLEGDSGDDHMAGGDGNDILRGDNGNDALGGDAGRDVLVGGKGNDLLLGGTGKDTLHGGAGKDRLEGGRGDDTMTGGGGSDRFVFARNTGTDTVTDYDKDVDRLVFEGVRKVDLTIERLGGDTLLHFGADTVVLDGVTLTRGDIDMVFG